MSFEVSGATHELAPIAVFAYDRPDHLKRCIESLQANDLASSSDLFVFSDAARTSEKSSNVGKVRAYIRSIDGFKNVTVVERRVNVGLARSIITGVTNLTRDFGKVIVVEDDLVVSRHFLKFMNDGLNFYADDERVAGIQGYMFPVGPTLPETFFLRDPGCWGWATWKRSWLLFEADGRRLKNEIVRRRLTRAFDFDGQYDYSGMLNDQIAGRNDSWAIRWYASVFLSEMLVLHPRVSLVRNIGQDYTGTHDGATSSFDVQPSEVPISVAAIPMVESLAARQAITAFFRSMRKPLIVEVGTRAALRIRRALLGR